MKNEKEIDKIYEFVIMHCEAICSKCGKNETLYAIDDFEASERFFENGWIVKDGSLLCKDCR